MSQSYYVYALLDSGDLGPFRYGHRKFTCQPFYIGKGKNLRHTKHEETAFKRADGNYISQTHKSRKIRKIHREGNEVVCKIVAKDLSESEAFNLEKSLILKIGRSDLKEGPLTNKTDGGEGLTRIKTKKRTRELLSISASLQQMSYTETRKKEIKAKISATVKTYAANLPRSAIDERVAKMLETNAHQSTVKKARRTAKLSRSMVEACSRKTAKAKKASQSNLVKSKWREDEDKVSEWKFQLSKTDRKSVV